MRRATTCCQVVSVPRPHGGGGVDLVAAVRPRCETQKGYSPRWRPTSPPGLRNGGGRGAGGGGERRGGSNEGVGGRGGGAFGAECGLAGEDFGAPGDLGAADTRKDQKGRRQLKQPS